ncbi:MULTISPECIES: hypothetical protein [Mesobacillus]|uniref:Uncharacterized protein n=1 Tax=Mesobacillus selenatarsenatis TaxID=388741 RepID=A0A846TLX6_9BACI|nr:MULTISPECIES: hypothetical protein [Mesobacillus]NKE06642.1 hypothetical protein [Mesobacillus selenatarsenatis]
MKRVFLLLVAMVLMGFGSIEVNRHVPPEVFETAMDNYQEFLSFVINDGNPEDWKIGQFVADHQLVIDNKLNIAIRPLNQWVAPVLYNGLIIGPMRVNKSSEGRYEIVEFGFSRSTSLLQLKPDEYFLSNMQYDLELGYTPSRDYIRPFGGKAARLFDEWGVDAEGIPLTEFEVLIKQHLKETYPDRFPEKKPLSRYYLLALIPIILIPLAVVLRKNKQSDKAG